jgi:DNA-directed RNA polymerase specialized sigma24 family protein
LSGWLDGFQEGENRKGQMAAPLRFLLSRNVRFGHPLFERYCLAFGYSCQLNDFMSGRTSMEMPGVFPNTHWSVVLSAQEKEPGSADVALETLCEAYWYPLYAYVRRYGHGAEDAKDLTQAFFARLLARNYIGKVDREKGRFRTFLLTALKRFIIQEWERASAQKRGGGQQFVAFDTELAEQLYSAESSGMFYLVMEFVDGVNLRRLLQDRKLSLEEALAVVPPICDALQYAHNLGVVHRDIKPETLLLDKEGLVVRRNCFG